MRRISDFMSITAGTLLMAAALNVFIAPCSLVTGGASGLAVILEYVTAEALGVGIPLWFTNLAVNIPLLIWACFSLGREFTGRTAAGTLLLSFFLKLTAVLPKGPEDVFIGAVFGGAIMGAGLGLVLANGASTGGSDLLAVLINKRYGTPGVSALIFMTDAAVVAAGMAVFGAEKALYSVAAVYVSARATSLVLEGFNFARVVFIMSDKAKIIAAVLMKELDRGATILYGEGAFTGVSKNVIMIAVSKSQVAKVKEKTAETDKNAFMLVADIREVMGDFSHKRRHYI